MNTSGLTPTSVVFIPAFLCDEAMYCDVIEVLGEMIEVHVLLSPKMRLEDSAADILTRAPAAFVLVGASCGGSLALEVALAATECVIALCLTDCDPSAPQPGGPDLAGGLAATPDTVVAMLAGLVVRPEATEAAAAFKAMAGRVWPAAGAAQAQATATRRSPSGVPSPTLCRTRTSTFSRVAGICQRWRSPPNVRCSSANFLLGKLLSDEENYL